MTEQTRDMFRNAPGTAVAARRVTLEEEYVQPPGRRLAPTPRLAQRCADARHIAFTAMIVGACCCPLTILALLMLTLIGIRV